MTARESEETKVRVGHSFPAFQLAKALTTCEENEDPAVRARATERVRKWAAVIHGIIDGSISPGSRTPLPDVPAWATPEVVTGGFATGALLAGGPLQDHERKMLGEQVSTDTSRARSFLNARCLTEDGLAELHARMTSGRFAVTVPEEGALLVVAWLVQRGLAAEARRLVELLLPLFSKLRFYPVLTESAEPNGVRVYLRTAGEVVTDLQAVEPNRRILEQREALLVWTPLYDELVRLFLETVEGKTPTLRVSPDGAWSRTEAGGFEILGGWPCQVYPDGWPERAKALVRRCDAAGARHKLCGKPGRAKEGLAQLLLYLRRCSKAPSSLSGRDVGRIRLILARYIAKRGTPDSETCRSLRARQSVQANAPTHHEIAGVVISRMQRCAKDAGLGDVDAVLHPATDVEARAHAIVVGTAVPPSIRRKVQRCLSDTIDALVDLGIVTSGDTLSIVLPQLTAGIRAVGIGDPHLRRVDGAIYRAFRKRRSLLLLDLQKQVQLEELPWVAAIEKFRSRSVPARELARQTLEEVALLTIVSFPQALVPNKLLQEMRALARGAEIDLPLVDELAADIFMGEFSPRFLEAAKHAARLLRGSLYETYYAIDYGQLCAMAGPDQFGRRWLRRSRVDPFGALCAARAGVKLDAWDPATNGMIIEQQQILTTQNLAVLFGSLNLSDRTLDRYEELSRRCFRWVCKRQQVKMNEWHARLISVKNAAYAWRQMVFFLSFLPSDTLHGFLAWAEEHLDAQPVGFRERFYPALLGLRAAAHARPVDAEPGARRFLGWSKRGHWLLA